MAGITKYGRFSDLIGGLATITASGVVSADANYGLSALTGINPAIPLKFLTTGPVRIVWDFGSARQIAGMAMPNSNCDEGLAIRAELNSTNSWTTPAVSVAMPPGPDDLMGHRASPWADFTTASGYANFRYASLYLPANTVAIQLFAFPIGTLRAFSRHIQFDGEKGVKRRTAEGIETEYGVVRVTRRRIRQRVHRFRVRGNDADHNDIQAIADDAGARALPWFFVWDSDVKTDGGLYVRFDKATAERLSSSEVWFDINDFGGEVEEVSRSLPL